MADVETWLHCSLAIVAAKVESPETRELMSFSCWPVNMAESLRHPLPPVSGCRPPLAVNGIEPVHDGDGHVAVRRAGLCLLPVA